MRLQTPKGPIYNIVSDGAMSNPLLAEGKFILGLIIDADKNSTISELIDYHQETPAGDATFNWSRPLSLTYFKTVILYIEFLKPMKTEFGISFDIESQFHLIDGIIQSRAFFLQTGMLGDKFSDFNKSKILLEVPQLEFDKRWESILLECVKALYRKKGAPKSQLKPLAKEHIKGMREMWNRKQRNDTAKQ